MGADKETRQRGEIGKLLESGEIEYLTLGYHTVEIEGIKVEVTLKRVKNINCRIRGGKVYMSVPYQLSPDQIEKAVRDMMPWIKKQLAAASAKKGGKPYQDPNEYDLEIEGLSIHVIRKKVKNYNMRITNEGIPQMSVPERATAADVERVARAHVDWFKEALSANQSRRTAAPTKWETGDTLMVWGKERTIKVEEGAQIPFCKLDGDTLQVLVPIGADRETRAYAVEDFLYDELWRHLGEILDDCEARVGKRAVSISLRRMKTRWGSCTKARGTIRLNIALAECPIACTETVLIHELCHLWEANHGPNFYARLDLACPDWRVNQGWLNAHSPRYPAF